MKDSRISRYQDVFKPYSTIIGFLPYSLNLELLHNTYKNQNAELYMKFLSGCLKSVEMPLHVYAFMCRHTPVLKSCLKKKKGGGGEGILFFPSVLFRTQFETMFSYY